MGAYESYVDYSSRVENSHYQPILVALDPENDAVVGKDATQRIEIRHLRRCFPILLLGSIVPSTQGTLCVRVSLPKLPERPLSNYSHNGRTVVLPFYDKLYTLCRAIHPVDVRLLA